MPRAQRRTAGRQRVGRVSVYLHHGSWHLYYRDGRRPLRRRIGSDASEALRIAAEVNAELATDRPTMFSFSPTTVAALRQRFLEHHEFVLNSSLATVNRYRSATKFLADFAGSTPAHRIDPDQFLRHLRSLQVSPNGHPKTVKRPLREKGIRFVLETCRSLYSFAAKKRLLPPYFEITFAPPGLRRHAPDDAKPVYVFDSRNELAFFAQVTVWALPIFLTLAKTGLRPGELLHALVEDVDLDGGWWHVRSKPALHWWVKTRRDRSVPLVPELVDVLRRLLRGRSGGPVFLRRALPPSCAAHAGGQLRRFVGVGRRAHRHRAALVAASVIAQRSRPNCPLRMARKRGPSARRHCGKLFWQPTVPSVWRMSPAPSVCATRSRRCCRKPMSIP